VTKDFDEGPWYKQFWLWFLVVPVLVLMAGTFYLLYVSIITHDGVILDNHYKDGKGYSVRVEEDEFARAIDLHAIVGWKGNDITIALKGALTPLPETIELIIAFPTSEIYDINLTMAHRGLGEYQATLDQSVKGRRLLQLHPVGSEQEWRLHYDGNVPPLSSQLELRPK
jgi:hypothetical protein